MKMLFENDKIEEGYDDVTIIAGTYPTYEGLYNHIINSGALQVYNNPIGTLQILDSNDEIISNEEGTIMIEESGLYISKDNKFTVDSLSNGLLRVNTIDNSNDLIVNIMVKSKNFILKAILKF